MLAQFVHGEFHLTPFYAVNDPLLTSVRFRFNSAQAPSCLKTKAFLSLANRPLPLRGILSGLDLPNR